MSNATAINDDIYESLNPLILNVQVNITLKLNTIISDNITIVDNIVRSPLYPLILTEFLTTCILKKKIAKAYNNPSMTELIRNRDNLNFLSYYESICNAGK